MAMFSIAELATSILQLPPDLLSGLSTESPNILRKSTDVPRLDLSYTSCSEHVPPLQI